MHTYGPRGPHYRKNWPPDLKCIAVRFEYLSNPELDHSKTLFDLVPDEVTGRMLLVFVRKGLFVPPKIYENSNESSAAG